MQPKKYHNPKIALLNVELELKAEKDNAEVRVHTVEVGPSSGGGVETGSFLGESLGFVGCLGSSSAFQASVGPFFLLSP